MSGPLTVRAAEPEQLDAIMALYDTARETIRATGNLVQWINGYPSRELVTEDIRKGYCFVCMDGEQLAGVFALIPGEDPTYAVIKDGAWLNDEPYATIHRIGSSGICRGVLARCVEWSFQKYGNLRIDTHADNVVMRRLLPRLGFRRCGIIYIEDGSPRIAYQKTGDDKARE